MLPGPGLRLLIARKSVDLRRQRAGAARWPQPRVDLVEDAIVGLRGERVDQTLRQSREILRAVEAARAIRCRMNGVEIIDHDQIEIRARRHLSPTKLADRQDSGLLRAHAAMLLDELVVDRSVQ